MREKKRSPGRIVLTLLDAIFHVVILVLALQVLGIFTEDFDFETYNYSAEFSAAAAMFFLLAGSELLRCFSLRGGSKLSMARHIAGVALFAASGILLLAMRGDRYSASFAGLCYGLYLALGRVDAIRRDRRARSIALNSVALLLILFDAATPVRIVFTPLIILILSLIHIGSIAFSQINFRALQKVIRKTFAVEIIFGMLLLIAAFSVVLQSSEAGIETYADALWYCFAIVTTIGFGDVTVTGGIGRILSVILGVYGIIVVSLITSVIVNFYNEVKDEPEEDEPPPCAPEAPEEETKEDETL